MILSEKIVYSTSEHRWSCAYFGFGDSVTFPVMSPFVLPLPDAAIALELVAGGFGSRVG